MRRTCSFASALGVWLLMSPAAAQPLGDSAPAAAQPGELLAAPAHEPKTSDSQKRAQPARGQLAAPAAGQRERAAGSNAEAGRRGGGGSLTDGQLVQVLFDLLRSGPPATRRAALERLQRRPDPRAIAPLRHLVARGGGGLRLQVVQTLGAFDDYPATMALAELLDDASLPLEVRQAAAEGLAAQQTEAAARQLLARREGLRPAALAQAVQQALAGSYAEALRQRERLVEGEPRPGAAKAGAALQAGERQGERQTASVSSQQAPGAVIEGFSLLIGGETPQARRDGALALGRLGDPRAAGALGRAARSEQPQVQEAALSALGSLRSPEALAELGRLLERPWKRMTGEILQGAGAFEALLAAARDGCAPAAELLSRGPASPTWPGATSGPSRGRRWSGCPGG